MVFLIVAINSFFDENNIKIIFIFLLTLKIRFPHSEHIESEICYFFLHHLKFPFHLISSFAHNLWNPCEISAMQFYQIL